MAGYRAYMYDAWFLRETKELPHRMQIVAGHGNPGQRMTLLADAQS